MDTAVAVGIITGGSTVAGVALTLAGGVLRDRIARRVVLDRDRLDALAAVRHVLVEAAGFRAALDAAEHSSATAQLMLPPLRAHEQWDRYNDLLAKLDSVDWYAVSRAYVQARFAREALAAATKRIAVRGGQVTQVHDDWRNGFEQAIATLKACEIAPRRRPGHRRLRRGDAAEREDDTIGS